MDHHDDRGPATELLLAVQEGNTARLRELRNGDFGFTVNLQDAARALLSAKLLGVAAANGDVLSAQLLLDAGANAAAADDRGQTALHIAAREGHRNFAEVLVEGSLPAAPFLDVRDRDGKTARELAERAGQVDVAALLIGYNIPSLSAAAAKAMATARCAGFADTALAPGTRLRVADGAWRSKEGVYERWERS